MSIHVCKCVHNGREEFHLRYPGLTQSEAQQLADKINGGALNRVEHAAAVAEHFQNQIAPLRSELEAARGKVEALTRERDDARRGRDAFFNESIKTRSELQSLTAHVKVLTASLRATGVPQALLDRMLADAAAHP